ncbi:MAG: transcriptional repressor LexA [Thiofilum sp.]|uniref:transcriptional repressor LexA n=1 Tax=Thiofilum sp. TaxID=2212733 RepID=UPI0025F69C0D|nr:transcriptional repressor LexA [Thiofilum sp.]MBK8452715.1 repressor LexA [Thiofilum sp.]
MSTNNLTKKQLATLDAIKKLTAQWGRQPTLDEIAGELNITSKSTVHEHVQALIRIGTLIACTGKKAYLLPDEAMEIELPMLGQIAAGKPIQAVENERIISPNDVLVRADRYALLIRGDSMIDIGVMDGDYVVIQSQEYARNGEVVAALIDNYETTLKRIYYLSDGRVELRPENRTYESMFYPAESVQVQGKMVGLFRKWS